MHFVIVLKSSVFQMRNVLKQKNIFFYKIINFITYKKLNVNPSSEHVKNSVLLNGCQQHAFTAAVCPFVNDKSTKY